MRWEGFVILSALLVTKAAAICDKEDCETGLSVGYGVASVCATVGGALCFATGWATFGLSCAVALGCGVTAGVAVASKEACRACDHDGDGAGENAESLSLQMNELSLTAKHILNLTLKLEGQIELTQMIVLYGGDITNYQKVRRKFNHLTMNAFGLIDRNLDQDLFEKEANHVNRGAAATSMQIFKMMTGGHPLKKESIFQAIPESCQNTAKEYFIHVMADCYLLESVARAMRGESMTLAREQEFKKQLILIEDQFIRDCGCPGHLEKTTKQPGLRSALASLASSLPAGHCSSQVTYLGQPIPSFIMDNSTDRLTLQKITLLYSVAPFSAAKSAAAKATAEKYRMEEIQLAQHLSLYGSLADLTLYENSLFCASYISAGSKLHSDTQFDYFKIPVDSGVTMVEGATVTACRKAGMEAACRGLSGCEYNDESKCQVVPIETSCYSTMVGISKAACDGEQYPGNCAKLEGVFQYTKGGRPSFAYVGSSGGDTGVVGGKRVWGKGYTSGDSGKTLFAYCVRAL